jgi:trigger factor
MESMQSQVDHISPVLVEVKVEVPWTKVNENLEGAYRNLLRTARVRGFRPGKVPRNVVKSLMGKSVEREVTERLMEEMLGEVVKEHALEPVSVSHMDSSAITEGQPLSFTAQLEIRPKIDTVDLSALAVQRRREPVSDDDVTREIERLRQENAELIAPDPPRPAQHGDVLTIEIDVTVDGQPKPELSSSESRAELGSDRLLAEIDDGLLGATVGEERNIALTFPDDYGHDTLRGKPAEFRVRIKELQAKLLPEVDDEFARDLEHESLAAMQADIRQRLEEAEQRRSDAQLREAVVDMLVDANPVATPPSLVERQQQAILAEFRQLQQMLGRQLPFDAETQEQMHKRAVRKIRAGLLFASIAEQQNVTVSDAEVDSRLRQIADQSGKHVAKVRAEYQGERRQWLTNQILHDKLLEYLVSRATITDAGTDVAVETPSDVEAGPSGPDALGPASSGSEPSEPAEPQSTGSQASDSEAGGPEPGRSADPTP